MFVSNRKHFLSTVSYKEGDYLLLEGAKEKMRNADTELLFRQNSNFLYLCGVDSLPDCKFLMNLVTGESYLFITDLDDKFYYWHGAPPSPDYFKAQYGLTDVLYTSKLKDYILGLHNQANLLNLFVEDSEAFKDMPPELKHLATEENATKMQKDLMNARATKTELEIAVTKEAIRVSGGAHVEVMSKCKVGWKESHLESLFQHYTSWRGCRHPSYVPIVGTGTNGAILHYNQNNAVIKDGDLIVIDASCECLGYASDITRTFPANGKFTEDQRMIYSLVLETQKSAIAMIKPGILFRDIYLATLKNLAQGLIDLGFVEGADITKATGILTDVFMPHGLGHYIGLDVHDSTIYPQKALEPGMIITIEPGIYFCSTFVQKGLNDPEKRPYLNVGLLKRFENFGGVRIEDDVLVTEGGHEVLTKGAPKEIDDIESIMKK
uniref:Aminopeptidase P N-terminal domain-containing protein n=1 Tax=Arcella intermedia TaxID=1963864 RepID=A0A6B2L4J7_9EUKA